MSEKPLVGAAKAASERKAELEGLRAENESLRAQLGDATTQREGTRLPPMQVIAAEKAKAEAFVRDDENFTYLLVEDVIPGVRINQRNIAYYKRLGYSVASTDPEATGHAGYTLMQLPKETAQKRELEDRNRNNRGYLKSGDQASRTEIREGVVQIETAKPMRLDDIGASLPGEAAVRRNEEELQRTADRLAKDPRLAPHIERAVAEAEREDAAAVVVG